MCFSARLFYSLLRAILNWLLRQSFSSSFTRHCLLSESAVHFIHRPQHHCAGSVPPPLFENACSWGSSAWQVGAILGPVLSGFMYAWIGFANTLVVVTVLVFVSLVMYARIGKVPVLPVQETEGILSSMGMESSLSSKQK